MTINKFLDKHFQFEQEFDEFRLPDHVEPTMHIKDLTLVNYVELSDRLGIDYELEMMPSVFGELDNLNLTLND